MASDPLHLIENYATDTFADVSLDVPADRRAGNTRAAERSRDSPRARSQSQGNHAGSGVGCRALSSVQ